MSDELSHLDGWKLIAALRDMSEKCDYCDESDPNKLEPLSGGEWACHACLDRWASKEQK